MAAADRVAGHHGHHRLGQPADLHVQVGDVEAADLGALGHVARVAADALVAARAEGERALAGEDDHADVGVLARLLERPRDLDDRLRPEGVAHLRPVDGDLGDAVAGGLVADVLVVAGCGPGDGQGRDTSLRAMEPWLERAAALRPDRTAVEAPDGSLTYGELLERARRVDARRRPRADRAAAGARLRRDAPRLPAGGPRGDAAGPAPRRARAGRQRRRRSGDGRRARRAHLGHHRRAAARRAHVRQRPRAGARAPPRRSASPTTSAGCARCR